MIAAVKDFILVLSKEYSEDQYLALKRILASNQCVAILIVG